MNNILPLLSTHPQALYSGEVCVWGTGCDSVGGNHALREGECRNVALVPDCNQHTLPQQGDLKTILYIQTREAE